MRALLVLCLCASSFGCSASILRPVVATDAAASLEQVTYGASSETNPAVAPGSKAIAYEKTDGGHRHVEVRKLGGAVIYDSEDESGTQPAWMPDASSIVFATGSHIVQTFGQGVRPVFLADVGDAAMMGTASHPAVSPDGKHVVVSLGDIYVRKPGGVTRTYDRALAVTDMIGRSLKVIGHGTDPVFSPDGTRLAFSKLSDDGHRHIFVSSADGKDPVRITDGANDDVSPTFSPDGQSIAFSSVPEGIPSQANLFEVGADGSDLVQLTEGDHFAGHPSWGSDGYVYFQADFDGRFHIWRLKPGSQDLPRPSSPT